MVTEKQECHLTQVQMQQPSSAFAYEKGRGYEISGDVLRRALAEARAAGRNQLQYPHGVMCEHTYTF